MSASVEVPQVVIEATERLLKGYPEDLPEEQRLKRAGEDAALCASFIQDLAVNGPA